ncbi:zinc finger protein ZAT9-like [Musa acuminata AAA Group]|uniref:zinc finger protein ZAT9-like n=1 Tax=Musa acuminata AAA Group TaxID=214697 RepID=UPI0031DDFF99
MDRHTCNLCFRRFSNGRALGGHMRSHFIAAAPLARPRSHGYSSDSTSSAQRAAERAVEEEEVVVVEMEREVGLCYGLRMNPRKSFRLVDPEFSSSTFAAVEAAGSCDVVQDGESETESPRGQRLPTKRPCRATAPPLDQPEGEPMSSVSDATPEEDIALCLMMLSRDSWAATVEDRPLDGSDDEDTRRPAARSRPPPRKGRSRYQCSACKKVFRSYQALGGHRASHKRTNGCRPVTEPRINSEADSVDANADAKVHECPLCFRVFSSGQALGSHKRSHLTSSATTVAGNSPLAAPPPPCSPPSTSPVPAATKHGGNFGLIDLNLPAPEEDDAELSAVESTQSVPTQPARRKHAI